MGGIVIDIWEKSNFLGHLDHKKVPKMRLLFRAGIKSPPLLVGLKRNIEEVDFVATFW